MKCVRLLAVLYASWRFMVILIIGKETNSSVFSLCPPKIKSRWRMGCGKVFEVLELVFHGWLAFLRGLEKAFIQMLYLSCSKGGWALCLPLKLDGIKHMIGALQSMSINSSNGTGKEGMLMEVALYTKNGVVFQSQLCAMHSSRAYRWKIRDQARKGNFLFGVYHRLPDPGKGCWWRVLSSTTGINMFAGTDSDRGLQLPWHLLEKWHGKLKALFWSAFRIIS